MTRQYILSMASGEGTWNERPLSYGIHIIGRQPDCQVVLPGTDVSRHNTQLEVTENACWLMDLGSANGTQLDGSPLQPRRRVDLPMGKVFTIATFRFRVDIGSGAAGSAFTSPARVQDLQTVTSPNVAPVYPSQYGQTPRLTVRYRRGNEPWQTYVLNPGEQTIGRTATNQIVLDAVGVSRSHARIVVQNNQVFVADMGSRNGVIYRGQRIAPNQLIPLQPGDIFQIDEFVFELPGGLPAQPQPIASDGSTVVGYQDVRQAGTPVPTGRLNLLGQDKVTIGRAPDNTIVLDHPLVSRYHAVIERLGTRSRLVNTHSANGVYLNGQQVDTNAWLNVGDNLKIGPYQMQFSGNELQRATAESYAIDVVGLNKFVSKNVNLLKNISLSIGQNEFVALVGMSGAGKSTLMDAINGFRPATSGKVLVNGVELYKNYEMFRDDIGNVPQRDIVHTELTPEQALKYVAQLRMPSDTTSSERTKVISSTLEDLGLTFKKDIPISRLSGGQIKRVSIGVELLTKPKLFFLDEPTSGLDPGTEYEMMKLLRHLADQGRTIVIITHATKNVMFCDKAIILAKGGNVAFYGPPERALEYFDKFRTNRERLEKDMEFDDIYRILQDEKRGKPEEWRDRYLQSEFAVYTRAQQAPSMGTTFKGSTKKRRRTGAIKQFFILSARNIKCMFQDRASLALSLAIAPVLGLMNFMWGSKLFDPVVGSSTKIFPMWYLLSIVAVLAGSMGSVREIVKENEIYKRERAVGLKIGSYILSKIWVGAALSIYQGAALLVVVLLMTRPFVRQTEGYLYLLGTMILAVFSGYMLGLLVSALSPNQNSAQIILIGFLVPQFLFAGVLQPLSKIPLGNVISPAISVRWAYESFIRASGIGDRLLQDACWTLPREERILLTGAQKESCFCMGPNIFKNCADFPGILSPDYYNDSAKLALSQAEPPKPVEPTMLPSPTPLRTPTQLPTPTLIYTPTMYPTPTALRTPTKLPYPLYVNPQQKQTQYANLSPQQAAQQAQAEALGRADQYESDTKKQFEAYRLTREAQFNSYTDQTKNQLEDYKVKVSNQYTDYQTKVKGQVKTHIDTEIQNMTNYSHQVEDQYRDYQEEMVDYGDTFTDWTRNRQQAIGAAETILAIVYDDYGLAFHGTVLERWIYILIISFVELIIILILQKRKDVI